MALSSEFLEVLTDFCQTNFVSIGLIDNTGTLIGDTISVTWTKSPGSLKLAEGDKIFQLPPGTTVIGYRIYGSDETNFGGATFAPQTTSDGNFILKASQVFIYLSVV